MKRITCIMSLLAMLSACETNQADKEAIKAHVKQDAAIAEKNAERHTTRVANNLRDQTKKTAMKLREWWLTPAPEPQPVAIPQSYCYQVMQDIVCYRQPLQGMTHKLVGYQGDYATPPPLAQTMLLPQAIKHKETATGAPEDRVKTAKPVFVEIPTKVKEAKSNLSAIDEAAVIGNEPLPDPALSPQL